MDRLKLVIEAIATLFIIGVFTTAILPELAKVTGQSIFLYLVLFILMGIGIIFAVIKSFMD